MGAVGSDAASSAQSKRARGGEMACFRGVWGEQGCTSKTGAINGERGILVGVDSIVNNMARVWGTGSSKTPHFWGFWGVLDVQDVFWGCCTGSSLVRHCSGAAGDGPGLGRAGDVAIIDGYVAALWGSSTYGMGDGGTSWGGREVSECS